MNEYEKQAKEFCQKHKIKIMIEFLKNGLHFPDDRIPRNIYKFYIIRNKKVYTDNFAQSMAKSKKGIIPDNYDILACITKYDPGTFDDFCQAYGYDNDSIKALKVYKNVKKEWKAINSIFSDIIDELQGIQ